MEKQNLVNRIFAGIVFLLSLIVYLRTIAPTTSFWDCGEFITCSYILGIPHPPGAPFYLLIGRIFSLLPLAADIGLRVNIISALSSSLTVMFTYLIIVRLIKQWRGEVKDSFDMLILVCSGLIGSLGFAFTDTFWFNAVEAEVYAISMFFTSAIVWLILIWLERAEQKGHERYLLVIAYLIGLAIGVHLLMILALPAIILIIYFKYLESHNKTITFGKFALYIGITAAIFLFIEAFGLSVKIPTRINIILSVIVFVTIAIFSKDKEHEISYKNFLLFAIITGGAFAIIYPGSVQYIPRIAGQLGAWFLLLVLIAVFAGAYYAVIRKQKILSIALMAFMLVLTGYSTYTLIYIRSNLNPAVDENDPETMKGMVKYLNREQYGDWGTLPRRYKGLPPDWQFERQYPNLNYETYNFSEQMKFLWSYQLNKMYWRYFGWQFIGKGTTIGEDGFIAELFSLKGLFMLPFLVGMLGMFHHFKRHWKHASMITALFFLTGVFIVIYLNQEDPQPRERDYVYVGSYFAFAIWIGIGVSRILEWLKDALAKNLLLRNGLSVAVFILLLIVIPINLIATNFDSHDRSGNYVAYDYSYNILQTCEPDAIIFTNGDNDTFPLWFLQYVYNIRPDVRVVNLSLLNTSWYIKQLKNQEPKVPITLSDDDIDKLELIPWKKQTVYIPVSQNVKQKALNDIVNKQEFMESEEFLKTKLPVEIEPTVLGQALRVQDYMILNILAANNWKKPIYFAVTVSDQNKVNLDPYLRMDGLDFKLVPFKVEQISPKRLENNLFDVFQYRNLNNPDVYFNDNIVGLLQNYRAAFLRLAYYYMREDDDESLYKVLQKMEEAIPFDIIPAPDIRLPLQVGQYYDFAGRSEEFTRLGEYAFNKEPDNAFVVGTYVSLLQRDGRYEEALDILRDWQQDHPGDAEAEKKISEIETILQTKKNIDQDTLENPGLE